MCACIHAWLGSMSKHEQVSLLCRAYLHLSWRPMALSTLLSSCAVKQENKRAKGQMHHWGVWVCATALYTPTSHLPSVDLMCHCFVKLLFAIKFSSSNGWKRADDLGRFNTDCLEKKWLDSPLTLTHILKLLQLSTSFAVPKKMFLLFFHLCRTLIKVRQDGNSNHCWKHQSSIYFKDLLFWREYKW